MNYKNANIPTLVNVNEDNQTADMQLFGTFGKDLNGNNFANDMIMVSQFGFKVVKININSLGGSIIHGFSILNAMNVLRLNGTKVETVIIGVADSMAGIISAFGDRGSRSASSFSSAVIHEPMFEDEDGKFITIEELPDGDLKNEAIFMRDALLNSLSGSTGKSLAELRKVMKEGTRRSAKELKSIGMIDQILKVSNEADLKGKIDVKNMSAVELMAASSEIEILTNKSKIIKTMVLVNKSLGLNAEASETAQVAAIEKLQNKADSVKELEKQVDKLTNENAQLKTDVETQTKSAVETFVDAQIESGKFGKEKRDELVDQAVKDFDGFKAICGSLNGNFVDVTKNLNNNSGGSGNGDKDAEKLFNQAKEYHSADMAGNLEAFKNEVGAERFTQIEDAYTANIDKIVTD
jgi:ATP-dependent Clp endopeptidase proteolytic subunit ClpP